MAKEIAKLFVALGVDDKDFLSKVNKAQKTMAGWGKNMAIAGAAITGTVAGIGGASLKMAADFDSAMREINTMMLLGEDEFKSFSEEVRKMSTDMGVDAVDAAHALYQAISAGVPKDNAIEFLRVATKAAIGGVTDTETAVDGLTTVMNAFKIPVEEAEKVADIMFTTVKSGKTTFDELSASMFNVAPLAATAGVTFEDVSAALATMTKQGVPTAQATTQLRSAIQAIIKPTDSMKKALEELGYASGQEMLQSEQFKDVLESLVVAADGSTEQLGKMFGSVEGLSAVLSLTGENAQTFGQDLSSMYNAVGASTDAFNQMEESTTRQMEKLKTQFQNTAISIGNALMPALTKLIEGIKPIIEKVVNWVEKNPELTKTILVVAGAVGGLLTVLGPILMMLPAIASGFTLLLGPVGLVVAAIAGLIAIGVLLWKNWDKVTAFFNKAWEKIKSAFSGVVKFFKENWDKILAFAMPVIGIPILIARNWDKVVAFFKGIFGKIGSFFGNIKEIMLAPFRAVWKGLESFINFLIRAINSISVDIPSWVPLIGGKHIGFNIPEVTLPSFKYGGVVPGPIGQPVPVMAHGGEVFAGVGGGLGGNVYVTVEGSIWSLDELAGELRKKFINMGKMNTSTGF